MSFAIDPLRRIAEQHGVFLRSEARAAAVDDNALRRSVRAGVLTRVRHGSYTFTDLWDAMSREEQHLLAGRAVLRRVSGAVLSHTTAAIAWELQTWQVDLRQVHVTGLDGRAGGIRGDLRTHEGFIGGDEVMTAPAGTPTVPPVRAALETALLNGAEPGLVTVSSGLRLGLYDAGELTTQSERMAQWPGALSLHVVTRLARAEHESVGEVRAEYLFWRQGLPRPVPQLEVYDERGRLLGRCDFAWPQFRLIVEFDGAVKYQRHARPGETPGDVVFREKQREDALRAAGWTVVRITWADLGRPRETAERIRAAMRLAA